MVSPAETGPGVDGVTTTVSDAAAAASVTFPVPPAVAVVFAGPRAVAVAVSASGCPASTSP